MLKIKLLNNKRPSKANKLQKYLERFHLLVRGMGTVTDLIGFG
jgi:hypothetical protein